MVFTIVHIVFYARTIPNKKLVEMFRIYLFTCVLKSLAQY